MQHLAAGLGKTFTSGYIRPKFEICSFEFDNIADVGGLGQFADVGTHMVSRFVPIVVVPSDFNHASKKRFIAPGDNPQSFEVTRASCFYVETAVGRFCQYRIQRELV